MSDEPSGTKNAADAAHTGYQPCSTYTMSDQPPADALVLFGATGDLAKRKLFPSLYHL